MSTYVTVNVTSADTRENSKIITIFAIKVIINGQPFSTYRRYNEILNNNEKLRKLYPEETQNLKLPGKRFFGRNEKELTSIRKMAINAYVSQVMASPVLRNDKLIRQFFNLDYNYSENDDENVYRTLENEVGRPDDIVLGPTEKKTAKPSDFEFLKVLGKGSFGKVLLARHKRDGSLVAVKIISKSLVVKHNEVRHVMAERNVLLENASHPFLVGLRYSFQSAARLYLVLDYVNGGEMFYHLQQKKRFSEDAGRFYSAEISSALGFLHSHRIMYRDLKPENILLDKDGHVVLTDFGLSKENVGDRPSLATFCGTPEYLAPEIILKRSYNLAVDWWCLGALLYEILNGLPPFYCKNAKEMYTRICSEPLKFRESVQLSQTTKRFLASLLEKDRDKRLGSKGDLREVKGHDFFKDIDWELLDKRMVQPPFKPELSDDLDLRNFHPDFIKESLPSSLGTSRNDSVDSPTFQKNMAMFEGFSYVPPFSENYFLNTAL